MLIGLILSAIAVVAYEIITPKEGASFTEFYLLGVKGRAENYPEEVTEGDRPTLILGIVNQEHQETDYRIEVLREGMKIEEIGPVVLDHGEKWEQKFTLSVGSAGQNRKVEFMLYRRGEDEPYRVLHLWIDVNEKVE